MKNNLTKPVSVLLLSAALTACGGGVAVPGTTTQSAGGTNQQATTEDIPKIYFQPLTQTVSPGQAATFAVVASSDNSAVRFQWKKNGVDIPGATRTTYTTPTTGFHQSGTEYSVVVSTSAGSVESNVAFLIVASSGYSLVPKASDGFYDRTECVKDNSTGLIWEGKTSSGYRAGSITYTNFDSNTGKQLNGVLNPTQSDIDASSNTIGYVNTVRADALCGFTNWRMPTHLELQGLLTSSGSPMIDTTWFPNTQAYAYWSSSPYEFYPHVAWYVNFSRASTHGVNRTEKYYVRLVR